MFKAGLGYTAVTCHASALTGHTVLICTVSPRAGYPGLLQTKAAVKIPGRCRSPHEGHHDPSLISWRTVDAGESTRRDRQWSRVLVHTCSTRKAEAGRL